MSEVLSEIVDYLSNVRSFAPRSKSALFFQSLLSLRSGSMLYLRPGEFSGSVFAKKQSVNFLRVTQKELIG